MELASEPATLPRPDRIGSRNRMRRRRIGRMCLGWATASAAAVAALIFGSAHPASVQAIGRAAGSLLTWAGLAIALVAMACEFIDSVLGMGYGTTLTPILLLMGFEPTDVVPAVLLSELVTGLTSALLHHRAGNVRLHWRSRHLHVALLLAGCSVAGAWPAVYVATHVPHWAQKTFIGLLVLAIGAVILGTRHAAFVFSWRKIAGLGVLAAFNKTVSGGGYGPVIVAGQIVSGLEAKGAVGVASLAEGATCAVGVVAYAATTGISARLALPLLAGAMVSVPLAVFAVKAISGARLRTVVGFITLVLGAGTLVKEIL